MIIAVVNQKGGVGKTTLAVHLAVWHHERGRRVGFIDADGQSSSSRWVQAADPGITPVKATDAEVLIEQAEMLTAACDIVIADGPANLAEATRALLLVADLALVPCGATVPEMESTTETLRILHNARAVRHGKLPAARLVLSRLRAERFVLTREARAAAGMLGVPVCRGILRLREAIADAPGQRNVVWRMGCRAQRSAHEMTSLMQEIAAYEQTTKHPRNLDRRAGRVPANGKQAA